MRSRKMYSVHSDSLLSWVLFCEVFQQFPAAIAAYRIGGNLTRLGAFSIVAAKRIGKIDSQIRTVARFASGSRRYQTVVREPN